MASLTDWLLHAFCTCLHAGTSLGKFTLRKIAPVLAMCEMGCSPAKELAKQYSLGDIEHAFLKFTLEKLATVLAVRGLECSTSMKWVRRWGSVCLCE